jgi:hypothetical protein
VVGVAHVTALAPGRDCRVAQRAARARTAPSGIGRNSFTGDPLLRDSCLLGEPPVARSRLRSRPCGRKTTLSGHFTPLHEEFRHAVSAVADPARVAVHCSDGFVWHLDAGSLMVSPVMLRIALAAALPMAAFGAALTLSAGWPGGVSPDMANTLSEARWHAFKGAQPPLFIVNWSALQALFSDRVAVGIGFVSQTLC